MDVRNRAENVGFFKTRYFTLNTLPVDDTIAAFEIQLMSTVGIQLRHKKTP